MYKPMKSLLAIGILAAAGAASAQDQVVNLYSARHYPTDEALYSGFTKATGIKVNRVDSDDAGIMARLKAEAGVRFPLARLLVRPPAKMLKMYVLRAGFLDGAPGLVAAAMGGVYELMKYAKLWELRRGAGGRPRG